MTPTRTLDTQRLSTLAHAFERDIVHFLRDLIALPGGNIERVRREMEKSGFEEIRIDTIGNILGRVGSGKTAIMMGAPLDFTGMDIPPWAQPEDGFAWGRGGLASLVYAGKLIYELGMYDDFALWVVGAASSQDVRAWLKQDGIRPECGLFAEPTNLRIHLGVKAPAPSLSESHVVTQAAIETYESLFELPPVIGTWTPGTNGVGTMAMGVPTIGFGPGEEGIARVPVRQLVNAAQFYAAFPMMYVEAVRRR